MSAPAATRLRPAPTLVPAVASLGVRATLAGPTRAGRVLGAATHVAWVATADDVIVVTTGEVPRLPNGIEVFDPGPARSAAELVAPGSSVTVGNGAIRTEKATASVSRWWDPRPAVAPATVRELATRADGLEAAVPGIPYRELTNAVESGYADALLDAAARLLGRGAGLTPQADDFLAGVLASLRVLGSAVGDRQIVPLLDAIAAPLGAIACARTTGLSASLLRHALRGEVTAPAGAMLRALTGRGDVAAAHRSLVAVGHSSGPALSAGIVFGVHALARRTAIRREGGRS